MVEAVAKGTLVADVVAADTVAGVPPCIMGTFLEGKSSKQNITQEERWRHEHTRQMGRGEGGVPFNRCPFFLLPIRTDPPRHGRTNQSRSRGQVGVSHRYVSY